MPPALRVKHYALAYKRRKDMPLSEEFKNFYQSWILKTDQYSTKTIAECFDKYFTLFVISLPDTFRVLLMQGNVELDRDIEVLV
jgi:hypothetical protein